MTALEDYITCINFLTEELLKDIKELAHLAYFEGVAGVYFLNSPDKQASINLTTSFDDDAGHFPTCEELEEGLKMMINDGEEEDWEGGSISFLPYKEEEDEDEEVDM